MKIATQYVLTAWAITLTFGMSWEPASALDSPTSYGEVAKVDTPILRLPLTANPPTIDGTMQPGEWEDASTLSGFWYDFDSAKFLFMAPHQTQLEVYGAFDKENLYLAYTSPVYPKNSWLKARGRFPDVSFHPLYGIIWDDHIELELRPYADNTKAFNLGLFKWFINPIGTTSDQYWSTSYGEGQDWKANAVIRSGVDGTLWVLEIKIPLQSFIYKKYNAKEADGQPLVKLPPPDGTAYRGWFTRGIGGLGGFYNAFDNHIWNTTKTMLIFDSQAPSFQINSLGPIMDDMIDVEMTVKNHNTRSETVRLGFFIESAEGLIYSSYDAPELNDGKLELRPGEVRHLRLRKPLPGISTDGNVLWFDVRSAGQPAKTLFRTRLIRFHAMEGGKVKRGEEWWDFQDRRLNNIEALRPPRQDFDFRYDFSIYDKRLAAIVDIGVHGASAEARTATEAKLIVTKDNADEDLVKEAKVPLRGNFATFLMDLPELVEHESYRLTVLLFDDSMRIVGERALEEPLTYWKPVWQDTKLGLDDVVWEPFKPMEKTPEGFTTLKHIVSVSPSGLPAQMTIQPDPRELPLELRGQPADPADPTLNAIGRGPQLRTPYRFELIVDGKRIPADVVEPAKLVRQWKSEFEYRAKLKAGELLIDLTTQYDCDGSMHCSFTYGSPKPIAVDGFEMLVDVAGPVDLAVGTHQGGGMASSAIWDCTLKQGTGVVWDNADLGTTELYYSRFLPWLWFGNADRGFSWFADSDQGWGLDRDTGCMTLERNAQGEVTWRVKFVNHPTTLEGDRTIAFHVLTHPAKPRPEKARELAWFYRGVWADEFPGGHLYKTDEELRGKARIMAASAGDLPRNAPDDDIAKWRRPDPPFWRFYQLRHMGGNVRKEKGTPEATPEMDRRFEEKFLYWFERHIRIGRVHGWWWDETWTVYRSENLAEGNAYLRNPDDVGEDELPWQSQFLTTPTRRFFKRLARVFKENDMPLRNYLWANNSATCFEAFAWDTQLVEECGGGNRSYDIDNMTMYPSSLYRYLTHNFSGLVARLAPGNIQIESGDNKRLDRQFFARALAYNIGCSYDGPHGRLPHREQAVRIMNELWDFGFFKDEDTEVLPFWRNADTIRYGGDNPAPGVRVTVYRRPLTDGRKGFKAIIAVVNESLDPVSLPLEFLNPQRVLGGPNDMTCGAIRANVTMPDTLAAWWKPLATQNHAQLAIRDVETGEAIMRVAGEAERYGPIFLPYHDFRIFYAENVQ